MTEALDTLLARTAEHIAAYRRGLADRPVFPAATDAVVEALPRRGAPPAEVIERLIEVFEPLMVGIAGPRYFGFVNGGSLDGALCADLLAAGWDQNAFNGVTSPGAARIEEAAGPWLIELLGLPAHASYGFVTGGQAANTVGLAAARHHVLGRAGWDVERDGLAGAPRVRVLASVERHVTIDRALRLLGFGTAIVEPIDADGNGAMRVDLLAERLSQDAAPTIVCAQAGNVNSGACDDFGSLCSAARSHPNAWVHVDGAFGLWAAASPSTAHLVAGVAQADSWATDGHKWLNVPYDAGYVFCAHPGAHRAAMSMAAAYLTGHEDGAIRHPSDYVLESSRRARAVSTYAAIAQLGRDGVAAMVDRCCTLARRFARGLAAIDGVTIANDVVLNQVLVWFGSDAMADAVVAAVQASGECWMGATTWGGRRCMRLSIVNWSTTEADIDRSVAAIARAFASLQ